jgi:hypothetical protein
LFFIDIVGELPELVFPGRIVPDRILATIPNPAWQQNHQYRLASYRRYPGGLRVGQSQFWRWEMQTG